MRQKSQTFVEKVVMIIWGILRLFDSDAKFSKSQIGEKDE